MRSSTLFPRSARTCARTSAALFLGTNTPYFGAGRSRPESGSAQKMSAIACKRKPVRNRRVRPLAIGPLAGR
jgi:hypothetical protein